MVYRVVGLMSGSSLDGLDIAFVELEEIGGKWNYTIVETDCIVYTEEWSRKLKNATTATALDYQLLHTAYGHYLGEQVNRFMDKYALHYQVALIASHGHTVFHLPNQKMTSQLGCGAAIAATTRLPVVSDLRAMDIALGGQGAPIVPIAEKLLWNEFGALLNVGGIANISFNNGEKYIAFDICAANRVLNMLANDSGKPFDNRGEMAMSGILHTALLQKLNALDYYQQPYPKSLSNDFGTDIIFPLIKNENISTQDALHTYITHIVTQIKNVIDENKSQLVNNKLLITGGGAHNDFLVSMLKDELSTNDIELITGDNRLVDYKEAIAMALIGTLRWRQEVNVLASVTGAAYNSVGGALWMGQGE